MKGRCVRYPIAACLLLCAVLLRFFHPVSAYSVMTDRNVFRHHENSCMKIALTFDDGPGGRDTPAILDYLKEQEIRATFFVVGSQVRQNPGLLLREKAEGHEIGNHTDSHPHLAKESAEALRAEILACEDTVRELADTKPRLFRPPEGHCTAAISEMAASLDYRIILWNIDTRDWDHAMADDIAKEILAQVKSGDIILFHDCVSRRKSETLAALRQIVPELKARGYHFVTVSELIDTASSSGE